MIFNEDGTTTTVPNLIPVETFFRGESVTLNFVKPSKLHYSLVLQNVKSDDFYGAASVIMDNCFYKGESDIDIQDEQLRIALINPIWFHFLKFDTFECYSEEEYIIIEIKDSKLKFKPLRNREDYKTVFNRSIGSPMYAFDYIYTNLKIDGEISQDSIEYASICKAYNYFLNLKFDDLKKK